MAIEISPASSLVKYFWYVEGDIILIPPDDAPAHAPGAGGELTRDQAIEAIAAWSFTPEYAIYDIAADYSTFTEEKLSGAETPWSVGDYGFTVHTTYANGSNWEHLGGANKNAWLFEVTLKSNAYTTGVEDSADLTTYSSYSTADGPQEFGIVTHNGKTLYNMLDKFQAWRGPKEFAGSSEPVEPVYFWTNYIGSHEIP